VGLIDVGGGCVWVGTGVGVVVGIGVGSGVRPENHVYAPHAKSRSAMMIAARMTTLAQVHRPRGGGCSFLVGAALTAGWGLGCFANNGENASHALVSGLTCIPYFTPPCLAKVQLKNFSPLAGLKLAQLPQTLLPASIVLLLTRHLRLHPRTAPRLC